MRATGNCYMKTKDKRKSKRKASKPVAINSRLRKETPLKLPWLLGLTKRRLCQIEPWARIEDSKIKRNLRLQ